MSILQAIILGIIEGITEFLPISSTGHLILGARLLDLTQTEFLKTFEIAIQLGAILSVVVLYWKSFLKLAVIKRLIIACIPTAIVGVLLYKIVKEVFLGSEQLVIWSLFLGGIFLVLFELWHKIEDGPLEGRPLETLPYKTAFLVGLAQSIAIVPGVSRAAATIFGGLILGLKRKTIVEFSFLLAVPTMIGATGLDVIRTANVFSMDQLGLLLAGFISSFLVAIVAIKFLLKFIQSHNFIPFGVYRILVALAFWLIIL